MKKHKKKSGAASPHTTSRCKAPKHVCIQQEVNTIVQLALERQTRILMLGKLLLFSTESGDAWLLEPADGQSLCLVRDGEKQPVAITETPGGYGIEWNSGYRIKGNIFMAARYDGQVNSVIGYPVQGIEAAIQRMSSGAPVSETPERTDNHAKN